MGIEKGGKALVSGTVNIFDHIKKISLYTFLFGVTWKSCGTTNNVNITKKNSKSLLSVKVNFETY